MATDYYQTLGVERNASGDDIKRAFRRAAHKHHPDKQNGNEAKFKEANEAYQILSNKEKRAQYDQFGQTFEGGGGPGGTGAGPGFAGSPFGGGGAQAGTFTQEDLGEIFGDLFGFGRRSRSRVNKRGDDIEVRLDLEFNEAAFGVEKEFEFSKLAPCEVCKGSGDTSGKLKTCPTCSGKGVIRQMTQTILGAMARERVCHDCHGEGRIPTSPCQTCSGQGRTRITEKLKIKVPPGINEGQIIRLAGQGDVGARGGTPGDILVMVRVKPSKQFTRDGSDVNTRIELEYPQLVLGDTIQIQGLQGKLELDIPTGTQPGTTMRLKGEGATLLRNAEKRGDMYVELIQMTPKKVTPEERTLLEQLAAVRGKTLQKKKRGFFR